MKLFLDLSVVVLIVATIIFCWHRGFIRSVFGATKTLIAVIVTYTFGSRAASWLNSAVVGERITGYVYERFVSMFDEGTRVFDLSRIINNLPEWLRALFDATTIDSASTSSDYAHMTEANAQELYDMAEAFATPLSRVISDLIGFGCVFLLSMLILTVLVYLFGKVADLPIIRTCDRLLGFLLGVLGAAFYSSVYVLLLFAVLNLVEGAYPQLLFHEAFENTVLFSRIYEYNIFRWLFGIG